MKVSKWIDFCIPGFQSLLIELDIRLSESIKVVKWVDEHHTSLSKSVSRLIRIEVFQLHHTVRLDWLTDMNITLSESVGHSQ